MKPLSCVLCVLLLSAAACTGAPSRYGCPAPESRSCAGVSRVYANAVAGERAETFFAPSVSADTEKRRRRGKSFGSRREKRRPAFAEGLSVPEAKVSFTEAPVQEDPVWTPPRVARVWIAPWQDSDGSFHSAKYIHVVMVGATWSVGGEAVPIRVFSGSFSGNFHLRAAEK